jgi:hypothetical protein
MGSVNVKNTALAERLAFSLEANTISLGTCEDVVENGAFGGLFSAAFPPKPTRHRRIEEGATDHVI